MHPVIAKTIGGLSREYYVRQFIFGLAISAFIVVMTTQGDNSPQTGLIFLVVVNTLLYPYSRFVYESIVNFIIGNNVFFVNVIMMLVVKFITMALCWGFSIFISPVGFAYLYFYHSKAER